MADIPQLNPLKFSGEKFRNLVAPIAQVLTVVGVLTAVAVWGYKLQDRIDRLEAQLQVLMTASNPAAGQTSATSPASTMAQACATLAERYASAATSSSLLVNTSGAGDIKRLMNDLGCMK
jgi:hypothetical protein